MKKNKNKPDIKPGTEQFIEKARKVMLDYNLATGSSACIYDSEYNAHFPEEINNHLETNICPFCIKYSPDSEPCREMHINAIEEASKKGSFHIYQCDLGFLFWASPIYTDSRFSGAIRGGGFFPAEFGDSPGSIRDNLFDSALNDGQECATTWQKPVDFLSNANDTFVMCNSEISKEDFKGRVNTSAKADGEKVQSLAEMMQLCAESLSTGNEDYHEVIRRRTEQQEAIAKIIEELKTQYGEDGDKPAYPLEKEKNLMASLRKGDAAEVKKTLNELLALVIFSNPGQFRFIQLRIIELVVLISRVEINPMKSGALSMEINSQNLKLVQEAKTIEELTDIIHIITDRVSDTISSFQGIPHAAALRKAENFILENFTRKISLKEIADVAGLSPPYFSTIFKEEMGENLSKYLNRLRVEKASRLLLETDMSLAEIAACCCFEDQSWFSKIFKAYTNVSPGKYRNQGGAHLISPTNKNINSK
jgi:AraC-like DNA-binding protein